jgi:hypothetical protein
VAGKYIAGTEEQPSLSHFTYQHSSGTNRKESQERGFPSVTEVSAEDFQVYRKRTKTSHTPDRLEKEKLSPP